MTWAPPDEPDPFAIMHSAAIDTRNGMHDQALAKLLWFHHNALRYQQGLTGVRLSFALSYWVQLATVYPPAREALVHTRDETEAAFKTDPSFDLFHDLAALNVNLGDGLRTANLFVDTAGSNGPLAQRLYPVAERFLIAAGRYDICGRFLDAPTRLWTAAEAYDVMSSMEEEDTDEEPQPPKLARSIYMNDVATIVALLMLNQRTEEAVRACAEGLAVLDDGEFRTLLSDAMSGRLPQPLLG